MHHPRVKCDKIGSGESWAQPNHLQTGNLFYFLVQITSIIGTSVRVPADLCQSATHILELR